MTERNQKMRDALKEVEATVTATLAQQPEDDGKCSRMLYGALVKVHDVADLACHEARKGRGEGSPRTGQEGGV